jgi:hypothetical protein
MNFDDILKTVNKAFKPRKSVDFDEFGVHIDLEILDTKEEVKVLESLKDVDGTEYVEALKRHTLAFAIKKLNDIDLDGDDVTFEGGGGSVTKSKFIFLRDYLGKWPSSLIDIVFSAYTNMQVEVEERLRTGLKFDRFQLAEPPVVAEKEPEYKEVKEGEDGDLTETEKLAKQVEMEGDSALAAMARAEMAAKGPVQ